MNENKFDFLTHKLVPLVVNLPADAIGKWGKMNAQQMVEHVAGFFRVSTGKMHFPLITAVEHLPKYKEFLLSEKEFRENTKAPMLPEAPMPTQFATMLEAVTDLGNEVQEFADKFSSGEIITSQHPVFGDLNFEEWVLLHYKHVVHHAKQFGLMN